MAEEYEHLRLPLIPGELPRKKRSGRGGYIQRDNVNQFYRNEILELNEIQRTHTEYKRKYQKYIDPNLIFKIDINQSVYEDTLRTEFKRMDIDVISASPDKKGYWILFAEDEQFTKFKDKLEKYEAEKRYLFFNAIGVPSIIPPEDKIGERLKIEPFENEKFAYLDVEIWRMETHKLDEFLDGFSRLVFSLGGEISDLITTETFCRLRVRSNKTLYDSLLELREVSRVDRPPKMRLEIESELGIDRKKLDIRDNPPKDSTGILVVDSGVLAGHPVLENAIGDEIALPIKHNPKLMNDDPSDDVGHGTKVAGISLYGDIQKCIEDTVFSPELWIFSAKVMYKDEYGEAAFDEKELLEHQLYSSVRWIAENYPNCRIVNLSIGNCVNMINDGARQFDLSTLVDELSKELGLIFVVSSGNIYDELCDSDSYPDYLINSDNIRIIDPAPSALALTVGAVYKYNISSSSDVPSVYYPSPITRVGPGYSGMIKPELVENGGGGFGEESSVITINPNWIKDGRLFTLESGTSLSAPKVAHYLAKLINAFPDYSNNMIKALLISSSTIPKERPGCLSGADIYKNSDAKLMEFLKIYGYGVPNYDKSRYSSINRVILLSENKIKLNHIHIYSFCLPNEFVEARGDRRLSVTLVFDPPVNKNRSEYLGTTMEYHLFREPDTNEISKIFSAVKINDESIEEALSRSELKPIKLRPGPTIRKRCVHQKGVKEYKARGRPQINPDQPLTLVVLCQNRWIKDSENKDDENYLQDYAVVVSVEHSEKIDVYNKIRLKNRERLDIRIG